MQTAVELGPAAPVIIAQASGFFLCEQPAQRRVGLGLAEDRTEINTAVTRQLLAGCMTAAFPITATERSAPPAPSLLQHVLVLLANHQTTHVTPATMRRARDRFLALGDRYSADYAEEKAVEESGHDALALRDLAALGLPAEQLVALIAPRSARALVDLFQPMPDSAEPYGVFGYAYALERAALWITKAHIDAVQTLAPPDVTITRCMRVHSSAGADVGHVAEMVAFVAGLTKDKRDQVCRALYRTCLLIFNRDEEPDTLAVLDTLLAKWRWHPFVGTKHENVGLG